MIDPKIRKHLAKGQIKFDDTDLESLRLFEGHTPNPDHEADSLRGIVDAARKASAALQQFAESTPFDTAAVERAYELIRTAPIPERRPTFLGSLWASVRRWWAR